MSGRHIIVGLGNPGAKYEKTKHNIGFWVVDELARRWSAPSFKLERKALVADTTIKGKRALLVKPQTFMNASGQAVRALMDFYKLDIAQMIVAHDDIDIPLGTLRLRNGGSAGGQNGIKDIIRHMGTQDFKRVKCGVSRPPGRMDPANWVLAPFSADDEITARRIVDRAADSIETWLAESMEIAMTRFNGTLDEIPRIEPKDDVVTQRSSSDN